MLPLKYQPEISCFKVDISVLKVDIKSKNDYSYKNTAFLYFYSYEIPMFYC